MSTISAIMFAKRRSEVAKQKRDKAAIKNKNNARKPVR